jgi:hypothetical protein
MEPFSFTIHVVTCDHFSIAYTLAEAISSVIPFSITFANFGSRVSCGITSLGFTWRYERETRG